MVLEGNVAIFTFVFSVQTVLGNTQHMEMIIIIFWDCFPDFLSKLVKFCDCLCPSSREKIVSVRDVCIWGLGCSYDNVQSEVSVISVIVCDRTKMPSLSHIGSI